LIRYDAVAKAKGANMRRREFLGLGAVVTAAWPFAAAAQQSAVPMVGYLSARSAEVDVPMMAALDLSRVATFASKHASPMANMTACRL
jgi:hypothetical protein